MKNTSFSVDNLLDFRVLFRMVPMDVGAAKLTAPHSISKGFLNSLILVALTVLPVKLLAENTVTRPEMTAEKVLSEYLTAVYSRDAKTAYRYLSALDKGVKSPSEYMEETAAFEGNALLLSRALSDGIEIQNSISELDGARAKVVFDVTLPNAGHPDVKGLVYGFDNKRLNELSDIELQTLVSDIELKIANESLPTLQSEGESWELVLENNKWRVFENWADAVRVTFSGQTFENLGWEFSPMRSELMAKHGETVHMKYLATNIGASESTGKARHIVGPINSEQHLEIIGCFCFLEQTLSVGESIELPLVFRISYEAPEALKEISVKYEFFPIDQFPNNDIALEKSS